MADPCAPPTPIPNAEVQPHRVWQWIRHRAARHPRHAHAAGARAGARSALSQADCGKSPGPMPLAPFIREAARSIGSGVAEPAAAAIAIASAAGIGLGVLALLPDASPAFALPAGPDVSAPPTVRDVQPHPVPIPEPSGTIILAVGACGAILVRRRPAASGASGRAARQ